MNTQEFRKECLECLEEAAQAELIQVAAEYKGRKVTLNKPFRLKSGPKAYGVYVKNPETDNIILVKFGDPKLGQHPDDPERKASFRARHNCDQKEKARDLTSPGFWACWALWPKNSSKKRL